MPNTLRVLSMALIFFFCQSSAHTWNEQLALIGSDGKYTGPLGYSRGYVGRTDPGYNGYSMLHLLPPLSSGRTRIDSTDHLCHPAQREPKQSPNYPRLQVAPGSTVAMKYLENGHVTLPENQPGKPPKAGTAFVFGTTSPIKGEKIATVLQWTRDGKGGDGRGRLLAANNFDDGRCHQINSGPISMERQQWDPDPYPDQPTSITEQWCETDLTLPTDLTVGKLLTIYWVWQWPTSPGAPGLPEGKDEYYTTCSDFDVVAKEPDGAITNTLQIQDPQTAAVSDYKSRPVITPVPNLKFDPIGPNKAHALALLSDSALTSAALPAATSIPVAPTMPTIASVPPVPTVPVPSMMPALASSPPVPTVPVPSIMLLASSTAPEYSIPASSPVPLAPMITTTLTIPAAAAPAPTTLATIPTIAEPPAAPSSVVAIPESPTTLPATVPSLPPSSAPASPTAITLTALVTVTGVLSPTQSMLIVQGNHVVTFTNPNAALAARAEATARLRPIEVHRRRAAVHAKV